MRLVAALGGNALLRRGQPPDAEVQRLNMHNAARSLAALIAENTQLVVTHGNGPQIGLLALQAAAYSPARSYPLDILGAESEGMIGYLIEQELAPLVRGRDVVTLLTQTEVDPADPAFAAPSKPIGPAYDEEMGRKLAHDFGWTMMRDGAGWRRAVASPAPRRVRELAAIRLLIDAGAVVVCAGGGGIPVVAAADGSLRGIEAVVDKDATSALLAEEIGADLLLLLTDVDAAYRDWGTADAQPIRRATPAQLAASDFAAGSMRPKIAAACRFVSRTRGRAAIGSLNDAVALAAGTAGTQIAAEFPGVAD